MSSSAQRKTAGFTLVELLIAVTVISILVSIGIVSYTALQKNARDGRRQADLKVIQSALEQYHADQNFYPSEITPGQPLTNHLGRPLPTPTPILKTYLNKIPTDPVETTQYAYESKPDGCDNTSGNYCTTYCLYAAVENSSNQTYLSNCPDQPNYNYEVTAP